MMSDYFYSLDMLCFQAASEAMRNGAYQRGNAILVACYSIENEDNQ